MATWRTEGIICGCHPKAILFSAAAFELISVSVHIVYTLNQAFHEQRYGWLGWLIPWCLSGLCACLLLRCRVSQAAGDCVPFLIWVPVRLFSHLLCLSLSWLQLVDFALPLPAHASLLLQSLAFAFYAAASVAAIHSIWAIHDILKEAIYGPPPLPPPNKKPSVPHKPAIEFTVDIPPREKPPPPPIRDPIYEQWNRLAATLKNWRAQAGLKSLRAPTKPLPPPPPSSPPSSLPPPPPPRPSRTVSQEYL